jgi:hypothetical protein
MFVNEKIVYLALHKTGCSHVLKLLGSIPDFNGKIIGKHNKISDVDEKELGDLSKKIKSGNIRNPWDWYVSLWAFGCMKRGALYEQIVEKNALKKLRHPRTFLTPVKKWRQVYADAQNPELFRQWLEMLLCSRRRDVIHFGEAHVPASMGFMTYRYLQLYSHRFQKEMRNLNSFHLMKEFDSEYNFIDHFIYNENLENDFKSLMKKTGIKESALDSVLKIPRTNSSLRKHYRDYYDEPMRQLVREKEILIIEKHKYDF